MLQHPHLIIEAREKEKMVERVEGLKSILTAPPSNHRNNHRLLQWLCSNGTAEVSVQIELTLICLSTGIAQLLFASKKPLYIAHIIQLGDFHLMIYLLIPILMGAHMGVFLCLFAPESLNSKSNLILLLRLLQVDLLYT